MRRGIAGIIGGRITAVERVRCRKRPILISPDMPKFRRRAVGRQVRAVGRIGKRLSIELDSGDAIVIEPRMTGLGWSLIHPARNICVFKCGWTMAGAPATTGCYFGTGAGRVPCDC